MNAFVFCLALMTKKMQKMSYWQLSLLAVELSPRDAAIGDENELFAVELSPSNAALECKVPEKIHMAV